MNSGTQGLYYLPLNGQGRFAVVTRSLSSSTADITVLAGPGEIDGADSNGVAHLENVEISTSTPDGGTFKAF